ncbi:unnamed protein product, partial [Symbiodinium necroappetens]
MAVVYGKNNPIPRLLSGTLEYRSPMPVATRCLQGRPQPLYTVGTIEGPALLRNSQILKLSYPSKPWGALPAYCDRSWHFAGARPPGDSLLKSFCDEVLGGGASLGSLYAYLNLSEALLVLRPTCRALASASKAIPRLRAPLSIEPQDIEELVALFVR